VLLPAPPELAADQPRLIADLGGREIQHDNPLRSHPRVPRQRSLPVAGREVPLPGVDLGRHGQVPPARVGTGQELLADVGRGRYQLWDEAAHQRASGRLRLAWAGARP
jgi:hypothetical protein